MIDTDPNYFLPEPFEADDTDLYGWEDEQYGYEDYEPNPYDGTYSEE